MLNTFIVSCSFLVEKKKVCEVKRGHLNSLKVDESQALLLPLVRHAKDGVLPFERVKICHLVVMTHHPHGENLVLNPKDGTVFFLN